MKKFTKTFLVLTLICAVGMMVASCSDSSSSSGVGDPTYILDVDDVSVDQGGSATISYTLTASDGSSTATGFTVTYAAKASSTLTVTGNTVSASATAPAGDQEWVATAKKDDGTVVATKDFTITVKVPPYALTITGGTSVVQGGSVTVTYTLKATEDDSDVTDATVTITAGEGVPSTLTISGLEISAATTVPVDNYDFTATATKDGATIATKNFNVAVTAIAEREVLVTVTLGDDPEAALLDGEYLWLSGDFNSWKSDSLLLTKQTNGTWTETLSIPGTTKTIQYKVFGSKSNTENDWSISNKVGDPIVSPDLTPGVLNITVEKWYGRPGEVDLDELFDDPSFEIRASNWAIPGDSASPWLVEGVTQVWAKGDGRTGQGFGDGWCVTANQKVTIYQDIDLTDSGIDVGTVLTFSVYVFTGLPDLTSYQDGKLYLVCGNQTYGFEPQTGLDKNKWNQVNETTHDFTLEEGDIVDGKLKAGLSYTPIVVQSVSDGQPAIFNDDNLCTWGDDFSLKVKE